MAGLSIRAYARHRGVSHPAVRKAIATGRITAGADGKIDPATADAQWLARTDASQQRPRKGSAPAADGPAAPPAEPRAPAARDELGEVEAAAPGRPQLSSSYADSRAAREAYLARLAKLDFEEKSGKLVSVDDVRSQLFSLGRQIRNTLLGIPDRLAPLLVGETDAAAIHRALRDEISAGLEELSTASTIGSNSRSNLGARNRQ